ncbi:hypothetical protein B7G68_02130 [Caulobacter segnis]|uniref:Uncharacterized protein n=2 Tax=Caulobacter segnis TaxID=88688 RepID=D5VEA5_CAUST|nr:hypothetical protein [Caulobacter segnis]ADG08928.1 conserved hypothetical protein [Caulobacter segnis ATCC 21756]AVQ00763.1 hypothetical protein B7G68_02130 [Caulobacter segnis]
MTTTWTIAVKLGASPALAPMHEITVEAPDAPTALRRVAAMVAVQEAGDAELLIDGQEEVFSRAEVEAGLEEHQARS